MLTHRGRLVEDAVTGHKLKIEQQLLHISMATGQHAVGMEGEALAPLPPEELVWTLGADLKPGDRVRCNGRMGWVGWHNDEGALVELGKAEPRLYCGRSLRRSVCGKGRGEGTPCASCCRLMEEVSVLLGRQADHSLGSLGTDSYIPTVSFAQGDRYISYVASEPIAKRAAIFREGSLPVAMAERVWFAHWAPSRSLSGRRTYGAKPPGERRRHANAQLEATPRRV